MLNLGLRFVNTRIGGSAHHGGSCQDSKKWPCAYEIEAFDECFSI